MSDFVHLHCHTEYSLLDGAIRIKDLCSKAVDFGMSAVAITDHGNMHGAVNFYKTAKKHELKPVIGCEVYVAKGSRLEKNATSASDAANHLVLLAQNQAGYRNLIRLVSHGYLEGFHYKPRVDKELLARWNEGLIALSACLKGEVAENVMRGELDAALAAARQYAGMFPGRFYIELQANGLPEQERANETLLQIAEDAGLPVVGTNDCHYLTRADCEAHDVLLCIQTNACVDDEKRMRMSTDELYFKDPGEMQRAFSHAPEAIENAAAIAGMCDVQLTFDRHFFPVYTLPEGVSVDEEMVRLARQGLEERLAALPYEVDEDAYRKRLEYELGVINDMGFAGYFLIVQDFIVWAKENGIPVGPGRGSAAGSLVAYSLKITNLDPIRYNLLFERFLNVERVSLPDIDVDFCYNRREEVIRYVSEKYGADCVAQITTFGTMKARAVVRDVGRALGMSFAETDRIAKLIPEEMKMTIDKALEREPELADLAGNDPQVSKLLDVSRRLEGLSRHASTHAAGVVVSDAPLTERLPVYRGKRDEIVTQFDMKCVEAVGLIKFDFLGLKTLTVINDALRMAAHQGKEIPDMDALPLDDPKTYELLCRGDTDGVFQLESQGMRRVLVDLRPGVFEDLIALLALYRPGPLESGMVADFVKRKHGQTPVEYAVPELEPILRSTYGVILYQEQVMRIAQDLAGYSLGEGDLLRRAMGKKKPEEMAKQRVRFMGGATDNGIPKDKAAYIFDLMEKFAGYGFNKSHSAAYALISYQTAYLKAHFPVEFMAALITSDVDRQDKVLKYMNNCREMGIEVRPPDINASFHDFTVEDENIRFGLAGIKNVGLEAIREIVAEREKNGPYVNLAEFCSRVNLRKVTKRVVEHLIKGGACDCLGAGRAELFAGLDKAVALGQKKAREKSLGQLSLLGQDEAAPEPGLGFQLEVPEVPEWSDEDKLRFEKESLGFYLSSHPLLRFRSEIKRLGLDSLEGCAESVPGTEARVAVLITGLKEHITRRGDKMAFCQVEGLTGFGEVVMFPEVYRQARALDLDQPVLLTGKTQAADGFDRGRDDDEEAPKQAKLVASGIALLSEAVMADESPFEVSMDERLADEAGLLALKEILQAHRGRAPVRVNLRSNGVIYRLELGANFCVLPTDAFRREIEAWQGESKPGRGGNDSA